MCDNCGLRLSRTNQRELLALHDQGGAFFCPNATREMIHNIPDTLDAQYTADRVRSLDSSLCVSIPKWDAPGYDGA